MGSPNKYYVKALQYFARALCLEVEGQSSKSERYLNEKNVSKLTENIAAYKDKISNNEYYFLAGQVLEFVLAGECENNVDDEFNACVAGLNMFKRFLKLR